MPFPSMQFEYEPFTAEGETPYLRYCIRAFRKVYQVEARGLDPGAGACNRSETVWIALPGNFIQHGTVDYRDDVVALQIVADGAV